MWVSSVGTPHGGAHTADSKYDTSKFQAVGGGPQRRLETLKRGERQTTPPPLRPTPRQDGRGGVG